MIDPSLWHLMVIARVIFMICFLPVLVYRVWRLWRYPASAPAIAVTCFGIALWLWLILLSDFWWSALPAVVRAVSMGGCFVVIVAACTQIFVLGISGSAAAAQAQRGRRTIAAVTIVIIAVVAISASRSPLLMETQDLYTVTNALLHSPDRWAIVSSVVGNGYLAVSLLQLAWVGFRHADWTPVGTGLGLLAVAASFEIFSVVFGGVWRPLAGGRDVVPDKFGVVLQGVSGSVGLSMLALAFLWAPVVLRVRARRDASRLRPLRAALVRMFPQLFPPGESQIRLSDLVFEWTTHIQDGLTLLAQHQRIPMHTAIAVPQNQADRAAQVMNWLIGEPAAGFSCEWLRAPAGVSDEGWILVIADDFRCSGKPLVADPIARHPESAGA